MTKQEVVRELEKRLKDKESFISNVIPSNDLDEVTRAMLITFIDKVEVLENSQINFVFNNIDTVNLLEKLAEKNKATIAKKSAKPISLHQAYAKIDPTPRYVSVGGGM